jgi:hypothetical protein
MLVHTSQSPSLLFTRLSHFHLREFRPFSSSTCGLHSILQHGTQHRGFTTQKCKFLSENDIYRAVTNSPPRFDQNVRTLAQAFAAMNNCKSSKTVLFYDRASANSSVGFWNFIVSRFTPQMFTSMGYGVYFFFASLMIGSVIFVYFLMPETKNIPLEGIDRLFDRRLKASEAHSIVWKELAEEEDALRIGLTSGTMERTILLRRSRMSSKRSNCTKTSLWRAFSCMGL